MGCGGGVGGGGGDHVIVGMLLLMLVVMLALVPSAESNCLRTPILFNFGDSNSDTGGIAAGMGYVLGPPEGRAFFHPASGRVCDGRLVIDFLCESLNISYLSPYLESLGSNFTNGANFAIAGATTMPRNVPFSLNIQVMEFLHFRTRSLQLLPQGKGSLINDEGFRKALYTIDIGQNDLTAAFSNNMTYAQILNEKIPSVLSEIKIAIQTIYGQAGGRNFWIHGTGPLGCLPEKLSRYNKDGTDLDSAGCLMVMNNASKALNTGLDALSDQLGTELSNVTIVYTDLYAIKYDIISNYKSYGFDTSLMACCGYGGPPYNFNISIQCLAPGFQVCPENSRHVSWDGVHYSEAANSIVATKILSTDYSKPSVKFDSFCNTA